MKGTELSPREEMDLIKGKLGYDTFDAPVSDWLNTGSSRLNSVLGSEEFGLAYGRMIEVYGPESHGKTLLSLLIASLAQKDGADVAWVDLERSWDDDWARLHDVDPERVYVHKVEMGKFRGDAQSAEPRLETAQEILKRVETWMARRNKVRPNGKKLVVIDSVAAMLVEEESEAGLINQNMRTNSALSMFLSKFLRRWAPIAANYNAMVVLVNQVRENIGGYGNPEKAVGGRATKHYCSVRATVRRLPGSKGRMTTSGRIVGLRGVIRNIKNKVGKGSREGAECGYRNLFYKKQWRFPTTQDVRKEAEGE